MPALTVTMGIALATLAESMPQFALLLVLTLLPMQLVSGPATPRESMPVWLQDAMQIFPTPHFVSFAESVLSARPTSTSSGPSSP